MCSPPSHLPVPLLLSPFFPPPPSFSLLPYPSLIRPPFVHPSPFSSPLLPIPLFLPSQYVDRVARYGRREKREVTVAQARAILTDVEMEKRTSNDTLVREAIEVRRGEMEM